jgi:hypothetical protein
MANGISGLPFPTFAPPQGGGGITQVKMAPAQVRFPTARTGGGRVQPETIESLGGLLGFGADSLLSGLGGLFGKDQKLTDEEFLENLGGLSEGTDLESVLDNKQKIAQLQTYKQFGAPTEKDSFGLDEIANLVIASQMGAGSDEYIKGVLDSKKLKETSRLATQTNRSAFLKEALKDVNNLQYKTFEDVDKARLGVNDYRSGFVDPRGDVYVMNDDKTGYENIQKIEGNWIEQKYKPTQSLATQLKDPRLVGLDKQDKELNAKDTALLSTMTLTNEMVSMLDKGINDPTQNPLTMVTSIGNFLNSAESNAEQVLTFMGNGDTSNAFATANDLQNGIAGSDGRQGTGDNAANLYAALQSGDEDQIQAAMLAFEQSQAGQEYGVSFLGSLGDMAYNDVRTRATMLQLAYAAAAANGQTGRTLSDKDLAFHLQMVGFGATQDAQTAKDNILGFVDTLVRQTDNVVQGTISENRIRAGQYPINDDLFTSILSGYWDAPKDQNGKPNFSNMDDVTFRNFFKRYSRIPDVIKYKSHTRRDGTEFDSNYSTGNTVDVAEQLKLDTTSVEQLY